MCTVLTTSRTGAMVSNSSWISEEGKLLAQYVEKKMPGRGRFVY